MAARLGARANHDSDCRIRLAGAGLCRMEIAPAHFHPTENPGLSRGVLKFGHTFQRREHVWDGCGGCRPERRNQIARADKVPHGGEAGTALWRHSVPSKLNGSLSLRIEPLWLGLGPRLLGTLGGGSLFKLGAGLFRQLARRALFPNSSRGGVPRSQCGRVGRVEFRARRYDPPIALPHFPSESI